MRRDWLAHTHFLPTRQFYFWAGTRSFIVRISSSARCFARFSFSYALFRYPSRAVFRLRELDTLVVLLNFLNSVHSTPLLWPQDAAVTLLVLALSAAHYLSRASFRAKTGESPLTRLLFAGSR